MWSPSTNPAHKFTLSHPCETFSDKYDEIQEQLQTILGVDELLSGKHDHAVVCLVNVVVKLIGMLSKSKGLILRIAGVLHVLFHLNSPENIPNEISEEAIKAAEDFINVCCQHTAFLSGRGDIDDAIKSLQRGLFVY